MSELNIKNTFSPLLFLFYSFIRPENTGQLKSNCEKTHYMYRKMFFPRFLWPTDKVLCHAVRWPRQTLDELEPTSCCLVIVLQCLQRGRALTTAVRGSLPAAWLPGPRRPRGAQPGVPAHPPPDAASAPGQGGVTGGGVKGQRILLSAWDPPSGRGLHLRPAVHPAAAVAEDETLMLIGQFNHPQMGGAFRSQHNLLFIYSPSHLFKYVNIG